MNSGCPGQTVDGCTFPFPTDLTAPHIQIHLIHLQYCLAALKIGFLRPLILLLTFLLACLSLHLHHFNSLLTGHRASDPSILLFP